MPAGRVDAVEALRALVRIPTVSHLDPAQRDAAPFVAFEDELRRLFPLLHEHTEAVEIGGHAHLRRWPGRSSERPVVLMAHVDVVPVDADATWRHPPWEAVVADGAVWGRGTLDDKGPLVAVAAAVENLLARGVVPGQDVWLSFGTTEEVSGETADLAVDALAARGVEPWFVVDEGGAVAGGAFPGIDRAVAVVGVTEKGTTTLELRVDGRGGHASTPARLDPTARLARAIVRLDRHPMPSRLLPPVSELFRRIAPHAPAPLRPVLARAERLSPLLHRALRHVGAEPAAMVRTTLAVTTLSGSPAHNVVASTARAGVNVRVLPGDTVADVVRHVRRTVRDDRVEVRIVEAGEASPVSPVDDEAFALLERTISAQFPEAVVAPYVMMAATDSRRFTRICPRVYRWSPLRMSVEQRRSIHSYDEHVGVDDLADAVRWWERLLEELP